MLVAPLSSGADFGRSRTTVPPGHWSYDTFTVFLTVFQGQRSHQDIYRPVCVRNTVNPATVFRVPVLKDWDRNTVNTSRDGNRLHQPTNQRTRMIHARPTTYNGIRMRSRLEASFAERLDAVGAPWQYEPQCFASPEGQYLPDFVVDGEYVEIKPPVADLDAAHKRMHIILASEPDAVLYVVTNSTTGWQRVRICKPCEGSGCTCTRQRQPCSPACGCHPAEAEVKAQLREPDPKCHQCNQPATQIATTGTGPADGTFRYLCDNCGIPTRREGAAAAARRQLAERNRTHIGRGCDGCDRPATQASPIEDFDLYLCNECSAKNTAAQERRRRIGEQYQCDRCPNPATNVIEDEDGDLALCDIHAWQASTDGTLAP